MTEADLKILSRFDAVWQRVQGASRSAEEPSAQGLPSLMDDLYALQWGYKFLAQKGKGKLAEALCRLYADMEDALFTLRLRHFLDTAEIYIPEKMCIFASSTLVNLRNLREEAREMTEKLQNASEWKPCLESVERETLIGILVKHRAVLEGIIGQLLR